MKSLAFISSVLAFVLGGSLLVVGCDRLVNQDTPVNLFLVQLQALKAPELLRPKNGGVITTSDQITLRWKDVTAATSYSAEVSTDSTFSSIIFSAKIDTTSVRSAPLIDRRYFWRARAYNAVESAGPWSDVWTFTRRSLN